MKSKSSNERLSDYVFHNQDEVGAKITDSVRHSYTMELLKEHQKKISGGPRRVSSSNSYSEIHAQAIGPLTTNLIQTSISCSFETFKLFLRQYEMSVADFSIHKPYCSPSKPYLSARAPFHDKFIITCPTFMSLYIALGITNEQIRREILWKREKDAFRFVGTFVCDQFNQETPGFVLLGRPFIHNNTLEETSDANSSSENVVSS